MPLSDRCPRALAPLQPLWGIFFLLFLVALGQLGNLPRPLTYVYLAASALSFVLYGFDKRAAAAGARRVSEGTLHLVALCGGWPGALIGRRLFRHKTLKTPFVLTFWSTVFFNCAALAAYLGLLF